MKKIFFVLALLQITICTLAQGNSQWASYRGYVPQEQTKVGSGTGFAIGLKHIATNYHVVADAESLLVYFPNTKQKYAAEVVKVDEDHDLAVVRITDENFHGFSNIKYGFKRDVENIGVDVFVLGYPLVQVMGTEVKLTTGIVSSKSGFYGNEVFYQISAPVQPGNSGGPLFNDSGELIGIVSAKYQGAENVSYAIKFNYLYLLASQIEGVNFSPYNQISTLSLSEKCESIIPNTVMLLVNMEDIETDAPRITSKESLSTKTDGRVRLQTTNHIDRPHVERSPKNIQIDGIERTDKYVSVHLSYTNTEYVENGWYNISKEAYIIDTKTYKRYALLDTENCAISPRKTSIGYRQRQEFILYFSPIPNTTDKIDLIEPGNSSWKFYGIEL